MRCKILFLIAMFFVQAAGLGELLHAGEGHAAASCEAAHGSQPDSGEHGDCHWHCGTCVHPSALPVFSASFCLPQTASFGPTPLQFLPAPPSANIFHPPA